MKLGTKVMDAPSIFALVMLMSFALVCVWAVVYTQLRNQEVATPKPNMVCTANLLFTQNQQGELNQVVDVNGHGIACT
jgi:hypothetical protein